MSQAKTGALGVFEYVDDATSAAKKLREQGHDVVGMTPTIFHELERTIDPQSDRSNLRWLTLTGALLGCVGGFSLAIWTSMDWPIITGGKEIISLPPFVVIGFECTILIGAIFNLLAMLGFAGLPNLKPDEAWDPRFSDDRIGLWVPTDPEKAKSVAELMKAEGAEEARVASN